MKLKSIIIDDEQNARENLKLILEAYCPEVEVVALAENAENAFKLVNEHQPNLVFLDIQMPGGDGFSFLEKFDKRNFSVVFTTAHNEYAIKALKKGAADYIEKPVDIEELQSGIKKIHAEFINNKSNVDNAIEIQELVDLAINKQKTSHLSIPTSDGMVFVKEEDIMFLTASDSYTTFFLQNGQQHVSSKNIKVFEESLNRHIFFRVHKSHIVNAKHHLKRFSRSDGNVTVMSNGSKIPVSRRKLSAFFNFIETL